MKAKWFLAPLAAVILGCTTPAPHPPLETVPRVDLQRYAGTWHEIARLPAFFQRDCVESRAEYALLPSGRVGVTNRCRTRDGRERSIAGHADPVDPTNARLRVRFDTWFAVFIPVPRDGNYWILDLAPDYGTAIVGTPDRRYLWLLARSPDLDDAAFAAMVERARALGFPVERLVRRSALPTSSR